MDLEIFDWITPYCTQKYNWDGYIKVFLAPVNCAEAQRWSSDSKIEAFNEDLKQLFLYVLNGLLVHLLKKYKHNWLLTEKNIQNYFFF